LQPLPALQTGKHFRIPVRVEEGNDFQKTRHTSATTGKSGKQPDKRIPIGPAVRKKRLHHNLFDLIELSDFRPRFVRAKQRLDAQEAEIMKNVPGWEAGSSVYHTKRWMPPPKPLGIMNQ
jgi:hypothetical protein